MASLNKLASLEVQLENILEEIENEIPKMTEEDKILLEDTFSKIYEIMDPYDDEL
jgi:hypothetical protein